MTRQERLVTLLSDYRWFRDAGVSNHREGRSSEGRAPLLAHAKHCRLFADLRIADARCTCWQSSFTELERALVCLRAQHPVHHAHLIARYIDADRVQRRVWFRHGRFQVAANERVVYPDLALGKTPPTREYDAMVVRWKPWVDLLIVAKALEMLEREYHGEIQLPTEAVA